MGMVIDSDKDGKGQSQAKGQPASSACVVAYTAAQIARALGKSKRHILSILEPARPSSLVIVHGNPAQAWEFSALPIRLQEMLDLEAERQECRNPEHLLSIKPRRCEPPMPLGEIAQHCIAKADKLKCALARVMEAQKDASVPFSRIESIGLADYKAVFGHAITGRHLRALVDRVLERDNYEEDFDRIELYLDERPARRVVENTQEVPSDIDCTEIRTAIAGCNNPISPNRTEKAGIWLHAFQVYEANKSELGEEPAKEGVLRFLWQNAPPMAASERALRVNFDRKYAHWLEKNRAADALLDGREKKKGIPTAKPYDQNTLDLISWYTVAECGGRISQAVRELVELWEISEALRGSANGNPLLKSRIPNRLREALRYDVAALMPEHQGRRASEKNLPSLDLVYDGIYSMDCMQADDFTWPVYFRVPDGAGWWRLTRGQGILVNDWRVLRVLGHGLDSEEQPNSLVTRTVFTRVFAEHGIPKILYLERGKVFQDSKLITGGPKTREALARGEVRLSGTELEMGLRQFGIKFIHARRARSKPVERMGGLLQDLMEGEPGYCGRDERKDCPEITTYWKREIERHNPKALEHFYTQEQWEERLGQLFEKYNATPQAGKRLNGKSPDQAFELLWNSQDPPTKFGPECRYLLAHHKIPVTVKPNGLISFTLRGETFKYLDEQTGALKGQPLIAWFNPELPEVCSFTDESMKNPFTVARFNPVNGLLTDDAFEEETAKVQRSGRVSRTRYRVLKAKFAQTFRKNIVSARTVEFGQAVEQQQSEILAEREQKANLRESVRRRAKKLGVPVFNDRLSDVDEGTQMILEARRKAGRASAESEREQPKTEN